MLTANKQYNLKTKDNVTFNRETTFNNEDISTSFKKFDTAAGVRPGITVLRDALSLSYRGRFSKCLTTKH